MEIGDCEVVALPEGGVWKKLGVKSLHVEVLCTRLEAMRDREAGLPFQVMVCFPVILLIGRVSTFGNGAGKFSWFRSWKLEMVSSFDGVLSFDNVTDDSKARLSTQMFERMAL